MFLKMHVCHVLSKEKDIIPIIIMHNLITAFIIAILAKVVLKLNTIFIYLGIQQVALSFH